MFSLYISYIYIYLVTKPTHLELDNGQVQARSTNGKNFVNLRN